VVKLRNQIVVVGGGTAGWLTALYIKKLLPTRNITLIESEEVGILGAGEGTTPNIIDFLTSIDIPYQDVLRETGGTLKTAIKFENWSGDGSYYYHPFLVTNPKLSECFYGPSYLNSHGSFLSHGMIANNITMGNTTAYAKYCEEKKSPFFMNENVITNVGTFALHFDARKLADYLKSVAISRGIIRIEGKVNDILTDNDIITGIKLENGLVVDADFVFDCSGFNRLIIGKKYNSPWKSYKEFLPVDTAMAFFLPSEERIDPYTTALAMKYGWLWHIPLQHRAGCGYIFDSTLISEKQAQEEVENMLGIGINVVKTFKFNPGCYEKTLVKNCIAIGVSSGFTEPLEATSIMLSIKSLEVFKNCMLSLDTLDDQTIDHYNTHIFSLNNHIMEFLYAHYVTARDDTEFWRKFSWENAPQNLQDAVKLWDKKPISAEESNMFDIFGQGNWLYILQGNNKLDSSVYKQQLDMLNLNDRWLSEFKKFSAIVDESCKTMIGHNELLNYTNTL